MSCLSSNLKQADYLLIETKEHLDLCLDNGLSDSTKVLSFNPYLVLNKKLDIYSPEQDFNSDYYKKLSLISKDYSGKVFTELLDFYKEHSGAASKCIKKLKEYGYLN